MIQASTRYRPLSSSEAVQVAMECADAWKDERIPLMQYELAVKPELEKWRRGEKVAPFEALLVCLLKIPYSVHNMLEVGASSGYNREVMNIDGERLNYTALDFSPAFKALAERLYPGIAFYIGDARSIPFGDDSFDVVLSGCVILHVLEYETAIHETARVAKQYAIFSKTPVYSGETEYYEKQAYGVRCLEIRFSESELICLFEKYGLRLIHTEPAGAGHKTYLLKKMSLSEQEWERA